MNEMILLGAGASKEANLPDSYELTHEITKLLSSRAFQTNYYNTDAVNAQKVVNFVLGGLLFQKAKANADPTQIGVNIEELFSAIELLAERETLEVAPFVRSWDPSVEGLDTVVSPPPDTESLVQELVRIIEDISTDVIKGTGFYRDFDKASSLDKQIRELLLSDRFEAGRGRIFRKTADLMLQYLGEILWLKQEQGNKVKYLAPLVSGLDGKRRVIATLNYDNTIELAASDAGVVCHNGLEKWSKTGEFSFSKQPGLNLLKVHGSLDWVSDSALTNPQQPIPHREVRRLLEYSPTSKNVNFYWDRRTPCMIFGQRNKLKADGPFLDLLRQFQVELSRSQTLVVIGYSFRDDHINTQITRWLNGSADRVIKVVNKNLEKIESPYFRSLYENVNLPHGQRFVPLPVAASEGIRELFG